MKATMKIAGVLIASMLLPSVACSGQSYVGVSGMVNAGYMWTPQLSSSLRSVTGGSMEFLRGYPVIGTEFNYRNGNSIVVLSGYFGSQEAQLSKEQLVEPFIWKTHAGFGWTTIKTRSLLIYPVLGVGALGSSLTYHNNSDPGIHAVTRSVSLDCSIHADYFVSEDIKDEGFFSVAMVSIRIGYTKGLSYQQLQGTSVTISFGGISFMKRKNPSKT